MLEKLSEYLKKNEKITLDELLIIIHLAGKVLCCINHADCEGKKSALYDLILKKMTRNQGFLD